VEINSKKSFTVNSILIVSLGLLLVFASVVIYIFVLKGVYGRFSLSKSVPSVKAVSNIFQNPTSKVAILYSQFTENRLPAGSTWLNDNIITWQRFLQQSKISFDIIQDEDIEKGNHYKYALLVLPGTQVLNDDQIITIKRYIDNGGSVFATGGTATYSPDGKWRGWQFATEVYGFKFIKDLKKEDGLTRIHTLRGNLPLTANIPTGFPLKIATWDRPIAVEVLEPRTIQVSFWYNYRMEAGLVREEIQKSAGIVHGTYGKGRFVWMGFELNSVIGVQEDFIFFDRLFQNSINWLLYNPIGFVKDWPGNYNAAAILLPTLNEKEENIRNLFPILSSQNVKANFMVPPTIAEKNPELVKSLFKHGEVGAILDIGYLLSVNDTTNKLDDFANQINKVNDARDKIVKQKDHNIYGIIPSYGLFDENSIRALTESNLRYIITDSLTDRSVPRTIIRGERTVISMTKTARDDYEVIRDFGLVQPEFQLYTYKEDVDRLLFEGGLYIFKMHTDYQCRPEFVNVVGDLIKYMKEKNIWITTASEIYKWWVKKNKIEMRIETRSETRIAVTVSNPGDEYINNFQVEISIQIPVKNIVITSEIIGTELPEYTYDVISKKIFLRVKNLKPGKSRMYYIDYDRIKV
jgi:peptidoglycan/xylan/chitin deacetylase (PgdA/CDA1 family)